MAEKRQKKQAVKAFEKETFSKDKEVTGAKHTEHRQDNTFSAENQFSANEKPVSNLPRDANYGSHTRKKAIKGSIIVNRSRTLLVTMSRSRKPKRKRHS